MSEKRFTFEYDDGQWGVPLFYDDGKKLCFDKVVDLLNEQQDTITELKSIINFTSNGDDDFIIVLMKEIIKLRQEVQECRAYETIEKGVSNYD